MTMTNEQRRTTANEARVALALEMLDRLAEAARLGLERSQDDDEVLLGRMEDADHDTIAIVELLQGRHKRAAADGYRLGCIQHELWSAASQAAIIAEMLRGVSDE